MWSPPELAVLTAWKALCPEISELILIFSETLLRWHLFQKGLPNYPHSIRALYPGLFKQPPLFLGLSVSLDFLATEKFCENWWKWISLQGRYLDKRFILLFISGWSVFRDSYSKTWAQGSCMAWKALVFIFANFLFPCVSSGLLLFLFGF